MIAFQPLEGLKKILDEGRQLSIEPSVHGLYRYSLPDADGWIEYDTAEIALIEGIAAVTDQPVPYLYAIPSEGNLSNFLRYHGAYRDQTLNNPSRRITFSMSDDGQYQARALSKQPDENGYACVQDTRAHDVEVLLGKLERELGARLVKRKAPHA